jgi:hypothetical protein
MASGSLMLLAGASEVSVLASPAVPEAVTQCVSAALSTPGCGRRHALARGDYIGAITTNPTPP